MAASRRARGSNAFNESEDRKGSARAIAPARGDSRLPRLTAPILGIPDGAIYDLERNDAHGGCRRYPNKKLRWHDIALSHTRKIAYSRRPRAERKVNEYGYRQKRKRGHFFLPAVSSETFVSACLASSSLIIAMCSGGGST